MSNGVFPSFHGKELFFVGRNDDHTEIFVDKTDERMEKAVGIEAW